jgi:hypothetical protein
LGENHSQLEEASAMRHGAPSVVDATATWRAGCRYGRGIGAKNLVWPPPPPERKFQTGKRPGSKWGCFLQPRADKRGARGGLRAGRHQAGHALPLRGTHVRVARAARPRAPRRGHCAWSATGWDASKVTPVVARISLLFGSRFAVRAELSRSRRPPIVAVRASTLVLEARAPRSGRLVRAPIGRCLRWRLFPSRHRDRRPARFRSHRSFLTRVPSLVRQRTHGPH